MEAIIDEKNKKIVESIDLHIGRQILNVTKKNGPLTHQINVVTEFTETNESARTRSIRVAQELTKRGVGFEDVIMICDTWHDDTHLPVLAAMYLGAKIMPLSVDMVYSEVLNMVKIGMPKILFCEPSVAPLFEKVFNDTTLECEIVIFGESETKNFISFSEFLKPTGTEEEFEVTEFDPSTTVAFIVFSSGTTGFPKGSCLTHKNICVQIFLPEMFANRPIQTGLRLLVYSTLFWFTGIVSVLAATILGYVRLYTSVPFSAEYLFETITKHKPQIVLLTPLGVASTLSHPDINKCDFSSVVMFMCIGSAISKERLESLQKHLPNGVVANRYGITECTGAICFSPTYKPNSCGKLLPWVKNKVVDPETQKQLGPNQIGELCIKSEYTLFKGYYNNPEATAAAFDEDNWFHTGDMVYIDEEGYVFIVDRLKELLKYQNHHVAPTELENVILRVPGVEAVCVVGIPHPIDGDLPAAFVQPSKGAKVTKEQVMDIIKENLSANKQLRGGVVFVEKLPQTHSGKINRKEINEMKLSLINNQDTTNL